MYGIFGKPLKRAIAVGMGYGSWGVAANGSCPHDAPLMNKEFISSLDGPQFLGVGPSFVANPKGRNPNPKGPSTDTNRPPNYPQPTTDQLLLGSRRGMVHEP